MSGFPGPIPDAKSDATRKSLQAILVRGAKPSVKSDITSSVASAEGIGKSKLDLAIGQERIGFHSLIQGEIEEARESFMIAYEAFPTYHNVDEISHRVLTEKRSREYSEGTRDERRTILKGILSEILTVYSWGIPCDLRPGLQRLFDGLG